MPRLLRLHVAPVLLGVLTSAQLASSDPASVRTFAARDTIHRHRAHVPVLSTSLTVGAAASIEPSPCFQWSTITAGESLFRFFSPVVYDPVRHRAIRFGGIGYSSGPTNDVWVQNLDSSSGWTRLSTMGPLPPPRYGHVAIYDAVRDRLIIFGGNGGYCDPDVCDTPDLNDVWALSLSGIPTWQQILAPVPLPDPREEAAAIYDPVRDRMIVSGGSGSDAWALSFTSSTWTQLASGPSSFGASAFYDATRDRMVLLQGELPETVWCLGLSGSSGWTAFTPSGPLPPSRERCSIVYDPVRDRALMFAGESPSLYRNDLWELTFSGTHTWNPLDLPYVPPPRWSASAIYDALRESMVVFGGGAVNAFADTWVLRLSGALAWSRLFPVEFAPSPRNEQATVWDAPRRRMIVFGGQGPAGASLNDVYALSMAGSPVWTRIDALGSPPEPRVSMAAIADAHDRMIVFGGRSEDRFLPGTKLLNDVWALSLSGPPAWTRLAPMGPSPVARTSLCGVYDPVRDRMIVFAGNDSTGAHLNDTWALDLAGGTAWHQLTPTGTPPPPMVAATAVYDPLRDRVLVFGGWRQVVGAVNTVWSLSLAGDGEWVLLSPRGAPPPPMFIASSVYDPLRDRVIVYGDTSPSGQVDVLSLAGTPSWSVASIVGTSPVGRDGHGAAFDTAGDRMIVFGGADSQQAVYLNDALSLSVPTDASPLETSASPAQGGSITRDPPSGCYANGTRVMLTATPSSGYRFAGWSGDAKGNVNPLAITMDSDKNIIANFDDLTATLVSQFDARPIPEGIELRWQLGTPELVTALDLERATAIAGPWRAIAVERRQDSGTNLALDRDIEPGRQYWYRLRLALNDGSIATSEIIFGRSDRIRTSDITEVAPNPSFGSFQVHLSIALDGPARLTVVDIAGRTVATLLDAKRIPGRYVVTWNANVPAHAPAGIYFVQLSTLDRSVVRRMAIVR